MATKDITAKMVCAAYVKADTYRTLKAEYDPIKFASDFLLEETGECEKVVERAMERAESRGLLDYGVSLRSGWLTDKGKELLSII